MFLGRLGSQTEDIHCREIRREFVADEKVIKISTHYHMINMMGEENHTNHWDPRVTNSWYTPRVFFLEPHVSSRDRGR